MVRVAPAETLNAVFYETQNLEFIIFEFCKGLKKQINK